MSANNDAFQRLGEAAHEAIIAFRRLGDAIRRPWMRHPVPFKANKREYGRG